MWVGTGAASAPRPPQNMNANRPPNGNRCKPLLDSKLVNYLYPSLQPKVLVTGLLNLKAPMANLPPFLPDSEVSIRELELANMNFVGLHWTTLLV
jgi:hypothetical protein